MLKNYAVFILLITVIGSVLAIGIGAQNGVLVTGVSKDSPLYGELSAGAIITEINSMQISNIDDWKIATTGLTKFGYLIADKTHFPYELSNDLGDLGISVKNLPQTKLDFGLDIEGGTRVTLSPKERVTSEKVNTEIIPALQNRVNTYGLKDVKFESACDISNCYIVLEVSGIGQEEIERLIAAKGKFEGKIPQKISISDSKGKLKIVRNEYTLDFAGNKIKVNNTLAGVNESFYLEGIWFDVQNVSDESTTILATVFTGKDIEIVYTDPQHSRIVPLQDAAGKITSYRFVFSILLSKSGAERFAKITSGMKDELIGEESYLVSPLILYLDDVPVTELNINSDLKGKVVTEVSIEGGRSTRDDALKERSILQTILKSGEIDVVLEIEKIDRISPTLGMDFLGTAVMSAIAAIVIISLIITVRYRNLKLSIPMVLTSLCETIIVLGIAASGGELIWLGVFILNGLVLLLSFYKKYEVDVSLVLGALLAPILGAFMVWTVDLAAIGGIIATIGTGINQMIIITDEIRIGKEKKILTWKEKIQRAFYIIFASSSTTAAAMTSLLFIGAGLVRGFAITTIIGILIGVLVTRPIYGKIAEKIM